MLCGEVKIKKAKQSPNHHIKISFSPLFTGINTSFTKASTAQALLSEKAVRSWFSLKPCRCHAGTLIHAPWITWTQMQAMPETAWWDMLTKRLPFIYLLKGFDSESYFLTSAEITSDGSKLYQKCGFPLKQYLKKKLFLIVGLKPGNSCKTSDELSFSRKGRRKKLPTLISHLSVQWIPLNSA